MTQEEKIKLAQLEQQLHVIKSIDPERYNRIMKSYNDNLEKAKYYKREGTPGNYKYYYTKEEWGKSKTQEPLYKVKKWER